MLLCNEWGVKNNFVSNFIEIFIISNGLELRDNQLQSGINKKF
jgi:hypothetical protein